jgi:hypothetical protein
MSAPPLVLRDGDVLPGWGVWLIGAALTFPLWFPAAGALRGEAIDSAVASTALLALCGTELPFLYLLIGSVYTQAVFGPEGVERQAASRVSGAWRTTAYPWNRVAAVRWVEVELPYAEGFSYRVELELSGGAVERLVSYGQLWSPEKVLADLRRACGHERVKARTEEGA